MSAARCTHHRQLGGNGAFLPCADPYCRQSATTDTIDEEVRQVDIFDTSTTVGAVVRWRRVNVRRPCPAGQTHPSPSICVALCDRRPRCDTYKWERT